MPRAATVHARVVAAASAAALALCHATSSADPPVTWRAATESPRPYAPTSSLAALYAACGTPDAALAEVAARAARRLVDARALPSSDEIAFALHAAGDPHPLPRAYGIAGEGLDEVDVTAKFTALLAGARSFGVRRCGVARADGADGRAALDVITVDPMADLAPVPTTARVGQWITLDARMLVPATEAKVVVLGPRGAPKTVLASLDRGRIRSTFAVDAPGTWLVQVLATISVGPKPVLEAFVHAGVAAPTHFTSQAAPGEDAAKGTADDADAMTRMVNAARASEGLGALRRSAELDRVARAHAKSMQKKRLVAHDVGDGDATARAQALGVPTGHVFGENVASAQTLERAHRILWASPSHRANVLYPTYTELGIGVVKDADGAVWVTETFRR
jgi:uncharacterized protein YkwD